jgi:hypothetical protein
MQLSCYLFHFSDLKFEDTTGVIRNRKLKKGRQYNGKKKINKRDQAVVDKILHRKLKFEQH